MNLTDIFLKILSMSLTASYCVLFICIARLFLRRAPKVFSYLLWSIVAVRLLCPMTFESNFSLIGKRLFAFTARVETSSSSNNVIPDSSAEPFPSMQEELFPNEPFKTIGNITGADNPDPENVLSPSSSQTTGSYRMDDSSINYTAANYFENTSSDKESVAPTHLTSVSTHQTLRNMATPAAYIWFAGMLGLFGYCALSYLRLHRSLAEKAAYFSHYNTIPVYKVTGLDTPFVAGFTKPAIYLPAGLEDWETCQCLAHEHTHIHRKDHLVKQFAFFLICIYWFQPLVWLAFLLMTKDMEMSCDEMTLRNADLKDRKAYSNALVRLSSETHRISGCPLAFGENNTSARIKNILHLKKPTSRMLIACSALLLVFATGLLADPAGDSVNAGNISEDGALPQASGSHFDSGLPYDPPLALTNEPYPHNNNISSNEPAMKEMRTEDTYNACISDTYQEFQTACPLYGTLSENNTIIRSMPKDSAPQVDILAAGDIVSIISFGKYMLQEDIDFRDLFLSDPEIQQEYQNFAAVLYLSEENNGRTARKGYIYIDALEISGNTTETYMYWIGKTWSEAFCSQDGATLYQMAADKKNFAEWDYVSNIHGTEPVQVEFNPSNSYPQHFYQVHILTGKVHEGLTASHTDDLALQFFVQTPEPRVWIQRQNLKIALTPQQLQSITRIDALLNNSVYFSEISNYKQITDYSEYQDAFLAACEYGPCYFDFKRTSYSAPYNSDAPADRTMTHYSPEELETLLEKYLNLSGGNGEAHILTLKTRDNNRITGLIQLAYVEYTFNKTDNNGQNSLSIPMYCDENGYWYIWVPGQDIALDEVIYGVLENFPIKAFE